MNIDNENQYSDEFLNALVDGEFPPAERAELLQHLHDHSEATKTYCQLRSIKEMVQAAYAHPDEHFKKEVTAKPHRWMLIGIAASLAVISLVVGLFFLQPFDSLALERFALIDRDGRGSHAALAQDNEVRIVFHVVNSSQTNGGELLNEVENVLKDYRSRNQKLRVEVVAHSKGLDLLRKKLSQNQDRIKQLADNYPNLTFVACRNTVNRIAVSEGIEVLLLPEAELTESGVAHVVQRQREGWIYIQV
jgi:intracellular sulfur oxidation DsrE/DsrF family protein